ncbi:MAG: tyrosine-protein phosphatase, partial [Clostridiales bacterium]|nr:tyrosine-protein phosphatase [Clostridiales bacterium]
MGKIHLDGADNARDLGGMVNDGGSKIPERKLIRSNHLNKLS